VLTAVMKYTDSKGGGTNKTKLKSEVVPVTKHHVMNIYEKWGKSPPWGDEAFRDHYIRGWMGPRTARDTVGAKRKSSRFLQDSNPGHPTHDQSPYW